MAEFVKPDPEQLVIVCISGYQFSNSLLEDKRFLQEISQHARLVGVDPEDIKRQLEKDWGRKRIGPIGMQKLRERLARDLASRGVRDDSVLYRKWSTSSNDGMDDEPDYGDLAGEINRLRPQHLVLVGHSYGGWTACRLSRFTSVRSTYIGLLDPMFSYQWNEGRVQSGEQSAHEDNYPIGGSIRSWWQGGGQPYGAREVRQDIDSQRPLVGNHEVGGTTHTNIDDSVLLHDAISEAMILLLAGTTDWPDDGRMK
jgi:pimeloyl-ACP methyl ester carboxylesterase